MKHNIILITLKILYEVHFAKYYEPHLKTPPPGSLPLRTGAHRAAVL